MKNKYVIGIIIILPIIILLIHITTTSFAERQRHIDGGLGIIVKTCTSMVRPFVVIYIKICKFYFNKKNCLSRLQEVYFLLRKGFISEDGLHCFIPRPISDFTSTIRFKCCSLLSQILYPCSIMIFNVQGRGFTGILGYKINFGDFRSIKLLSEACSWYANPCPLIQSRLLSGFFYRVPHFVDLFAGIISIKSSNACNSESTQRHGDGRSRLYSPVAIYFLFGFLFIGRLFRHDLVGGLRGKRD